MSDENILDEAYQLGCDNAQEHYRCPTPFPDPNLQADKFLNSEETKKNWLAAYMRGVSAFLIGVGDGPGAPEDEAPEYPELKPCVEENLILKKAYELGVDACWRNYRFGRQFPDHNLQATESLNKEKSKKIWLAEYMRGISSVLSRGSAKNQDQQRQNDQELER